MRLREIQVVLNKYLPDLSPQVKNTGGNQTVLDNRPAVADALSAIEKIPFFKKPAGALLGGEVIRSSSLLYEANSFNQNFVAPINQLVSSCSLIKLFLDSVMPEIPEFYFSAEIPGEQASTLDEASKGLNALFFALDQSVRNLGHPPLRLTEVESGSLIVELSAASGPALAAVGGLLTLGIQWMKLRKAKAEADTAVAEATEKKAAADLAVETLKSRVAEQEAKAAQEEAIAEQEDLNIQLKQEELRAAQLRTELMQLEIQKRQADLQLQVQATRQELVIIESHVSKSPDPGTITNCNLAIDAVVELAEKGHKFRVQVDAPPELLKDFPEEARPVELLPQAVRTVLLLKGPTED